MRKNRWLLLGLLLLATAGVVLAVLALLPARPGITKENFDRIEDGMTRAEVEEIFGGKANGGTVWPYSRNDNEWENDFGDLADIRFDDNDCVKSRHWDAWPDDRSAWQKVLDSLPWREREKHSRPRLYLHTLDLHTLEESSWMLSK